MLSYSRLELGAAFIAIVSAILVWTLALLPCDEFKSTELKDVESINTTVIATYVSLDRIRVDCRVRNSGLHMAERIILTARIRDHHNRVIATNPFGSVSDLAPNAQCDVQILLPGNLDLSRCTTEVESTLVRWAN